LNYQDHEHQKYIAVGIPPFSLLLSCISSNFLRMADHSIKSDICDNRDFPCFSASPRKTQVVKESIIYNGVNCIYKDSYTYNQTARDHPTLKG